MKAKETHGLSKIIRARHEAGNCIVLCPHCSAQEAAVNENAQVANKLTELPVEEAMEEGERKRLYGLAYDMFRKADKEFRKHEEGYDFAYWQGQKNVLRTFMAELAPNEKARERWDSANESAYGAIAGEDLMRAQLKEAMYLIGLIADEGKPHPRVLHEYREWVQEYKALVEQGLAEATPDFIGWDGD
jgi:hypothetical protein